MAVRLSALHARSTLLLAEQQEACGQLQHSASTHYAILNLNLNLVLEDHSLYCRCHKNLSLHMISNFSMSEMTVRRSSRPWLQSEFFFRKTQLGRRYNQCLSVLHGFTNRVLAPYLLHHCLRECHVIMFYFQNTSSCMQHSFIKIT
jgi:hypothetical protein